MSAVVGKGDRAIHAALAIPGWFERKVLSRIAETASGCWEWTGAKTPFGYGMVATPSRIPGNINVGVHRVMWTHERGPIPTGLVLDHDGEHGCKNRGCCNPAHLEVATFRHNAVVTGRGACAVNASKERCPRGHLLAGDNLVASLAARGQRGCKTCVNEHAATIREARTILKLTLKDYAAIHGQSLAAALSVIADSQEVAA